VESEPADHKAHDCVRIQTVLVVDDEASIREMLATVMELDGYRVLQAHDGRRALEVLAAEDVNVVTLDVMMPEWTVGRSPTSCRSIHASGRSRA
jgi:CheY-like chemotaxis protein